MKVNKEFNRIKFLLKGQPRKPLNMDIMESEVAHFADYAGSHVPDNSLATDSRGTDHKITDFKLDN